MLGYHHTHNGKGKPQAENHKPGFIPKPIQIVSGITRNQRTKESYRGPDQKSKAIESENIPLIRLGNIRIKKYQVSNIGYEH